MSSTTENNKRIAKNTLILYVRMIFLMLINLYTSRVILRALGVEDYGIYNVIGGLVSMFSIVSSSISVAISRFLTFELGKGDKSKLNIIFSTSLNLQLFICIIVLLLAETIGIWFLENKMIIPDVRMDAAFIVFQFTIVTFCVKLISIPYDAAIIAHEKMSAFAFIGIMDSLLKLLVVYLLYLSIFDKLMVYAFLMFALAIIIRAMYGIYCSKHFEECKYRIIFDHIILKDMFTYAGWTYVGTSSALLRDQGGNILINLFFGPSVNAARGIAVQVQHAVTMFVTNFTTALNPQITKNYALGNYGYLKQLIFYGSRLSFYLLLFICLPILINTNYILEIWLGIVPQHTVLFVQWALLFVMSEAISKPLITAASAHGKIRNYQLLVGGLQSLNFPLFYLFFKLGFSPHVIYIIATIISQCCLFGRLYILRKMINLSAYEFIGKVYINVIKVSIIAIIIPLSINSQLTENIYSFLLSTILCFLTSLLSIFYIGCKKDERSFITSRIQSFINKKIYDKHH